MSTNTEASQSSPMDLFKWMVVILLVTAAVIGNAFFDDQPLFYRVLGVLLVGIVAAVVAATTDRGRAFVGLVQDARAEVRRVVWPTKQETAQTTGIVVLVVAFMALLLWALDWALGSAISGIIG